MIRLIISIFWEVHSDAFPASLKVWKSFRTRGFTSQVHRGAPALQLHGQFSNDRAQCVLAWRCGSKSGGWIPDREPWNEPWQRLTSSAGPWSNVVLGFIWNPGGLFFCLTISVDTLWLWYLWCKNWHARKTSKIGVDFWLIFQGVGIHILGPRQNAHLALVCPCCAQMTLGVWQCRASRCHEVIQGSRWSWLIYHELLVWWWFSIVISVYQGNSMYISMYFCICLMLIFYSYLF